jgi:hypothetical protein
MKEYYLNDYKNENPVINVTINERERFAVIELSSVEEANRLLKLGTIELIDQVAKFARMGDTSYGGTNNL